MPPASGFLLLDANVLIDYQSADPTILSRASLHLGRVHVLTSVLDEIDGLDEADCDALEIRVLEPAYDDLLAAGSVRSALSLQDALCLQAARSHGMTCVTNDRALRKSCSNVDVAVMWGLELMLELVRIGELNGHEATSVAAGIHSANPFHISKALLDRFTTEIHRAVDRHKRRR